MLHARQLGLKLIANVTFGYTAASYSGRMPCIEVHMFVCLCSEVFMSVHFVYYLCNVFSWFVCLSVCLSVCLLTRLNMGYQSMFMKLLWP